MPRHGDIVPRDVREMYDKGLEYLAETQSEDGSWSGSYTGPGTTGMALMTFLASGEDPNYGVYSNQVRRAVRYIISRQDAGTGCFDNNMYQHGFAMLGLAEAYGAVDDRNLWKAAEKRQQRSIGKALELGVQAALTSQKKNQYGGWRYSPTSTDADTSVSGAVLVGLLAARNAGIEVPDESIDKAISYYKQCTTSAGYVAYSGIGGGGQSVARTSIASLVFSIARRKDLDQFTWTTNNLVKNLEQRPHSYLEYARYYQAQALFQGDVEAWKKWNKGLIREFNKTQAKDGSFPGQFGPAVSTSMSLLALALNYRFLPIYER